MGSNLDTCNFIEKWALLDPSLFSDVSAFVEECFLDVQHEQWQCSGSLCLEVARMMTQKHLYWCSCSHTICGQIRGPYERITVIVTPIARPHSALTGEIHSYLCSELTHTNLSNMHVWKQSSTANKSIRNQCCSADSQLWSEARIFSWVEKLMICSCEIFDSQAWHQGYIWRF